MKTFFRLFILFFYAAVPLHPGFCQAENLRKEIEEIIMYEAGIDFSVVPGVMVGVLDGDSTVSYTHLDVYKRQGVGWPGIVRCERSGS